MFSFECKMLIALIMMLKVYFIFKLKFFTVLVAEQNMNTTLYRLEVSGFHLTIENGILTLETAF